MDSRKLKMHDMAPSPGMTGVAAGAIFTILASVAHPAHSQDFMFGEPVQYPANYLNFVAISIGDVNDDRLDDIVGLTASYQAQSQTIVVYLQKSDGTLSTPVAFDAGAAGTSPHNIGIGDFDEDGLNDIAAGTEGGISLLIADGEGAFRLEQFQDGRPSTVEQIADIDGDGHQDILSRGVDGDSVLLGDGHGGFRTRTTLPSSDSRGLYYGDLTGDGNGDIVANANLYFTVLKGDGVGNFTPGPAYYPSQVDFAGGSAHWGAFAIGNFGGDDLNELVASEHDTPTDFLSFYLYAQDGQGGLSPPRVTATAQGGDWAVGAIARDLDRDGDDDVIMNFTFTTGLYLQGVSGLPEDPILLSDGSYGQGMAIGDLDDDGCTDLALDSPLYWNSITIRYGQNCVQQLADSDFDGDGASDVLWHNAATGASTIWRSADAAMQQEVARLNNTTWKIVGTGDFNGDRKADIVWHNPVTGGGAIWLSGDSRTQLALTRITDPAWQIVGIGDFDGDGTADLFWRHLDSGRNAIWKAGNYRTQQAVTSVTDVRWKVVGTGDFDGDGKSDVLWRHEATGRNAIWKSGDYHAQKRITAVTNVDWQVVGIGDFDGDGIDDLFWRNAGGANTVWRSAVYARQLPIPKLPTRWSLAAVGDYDGNGKSDLLWRNALDDWNIIWRAAASTVALDLGQGPDQSWTTHP